MISKPLLLVLATGLLKFKQKKEVTDASCNGTKVNTWRFFTDSGQYSGPVLFDGAFLNAESTSNNVYKLSMIGVEELSGYTFNLDLTFKRSALIQKGFDLYYSGKEFINSFSYSEWPQVYVYGAKRFAEKRHKMHFRIEHFDPATDTIRISFYGETIMNNGRKIKIDGITTALLNRAE